MATRVPLQFRSLRASGARPRPRGHTLLELAVALSLAGLAWALVLPPARRMGDALAVRGAREAVAALATRARSEAMARGGARLRFDARRGTVAVVARGVETERADVVGDFGAALVLSGSAEEAELYFDALGIGRVASLTVELRRGGAEAGLVFSSYGRVRRR